MEASLTRRSSLKGLLGTIAVLGAAVAETAEAQRADAGQPYMHNALSHLQQAKASLEKAKSDKGGHRENALKLVDQALAEVNAGINYAYSHR